MPQAPRRNDIAELEQYAHRSGILCQIFDDQLAPSEWEASVYLNNVHWATSTNTTRQYARNDAAKLTRQMIEADRSSKKRG